MPTTFVVYFRLEIAMVLVTLGTGLFAASRFPGRRTTLPRWFDRWAFPALVWVTGAVSALWLVTELLPGR